MPMPTAMRRRLELVLDAVDADGALVGPVQPVEDVHQRGLAGAVLAADGVDLARLHDEVDAVVGDDAREPLGDAPQLDGGRDSTGGADRHVGDPDVIVHGLS
jgi:hypothetical protein